MIILCKTVHTYKLLFFFLITVDFRASLRVPRLIPQGPEFNGRVKPSMVLRGLELGTIGLNPKAFDQLSYPSRFIPISFLTSIASWTTFFWRHVSPINLQNQVYVTSFNLQT